MNLSALEPSPHLVHILVPNPDDGEELRLTGRVMLARAVQPEPPQDVGRKIGREDPTCALAKPECR